MFWFASLVAPSFKLTMRHYNAVVQADAVRKLVAQQSLTALALDVLTTVGIVTEAAIAPVLRVCTWLLGSTVYGGLPVTDAVGKDPML